VHLEVSTKPHVHKKIHEFLINMAFTIACPNFKKRPENGFGLLGVKNVMSLPFHLITFTHNRNSPVNLHKVTMMVVFSKTPSLV
jgi:hypothetical protein